MSIAMINKLSIVTCLVLLSVAYGHVFRLGNCPDVEVMKEFDVNKFLGKWFVLQKFRTSSSCVTENVTTDGKDYFITESLEPVGVALSQKGRISFVEGEPGSVMKVDFPMTTPLGPQNYWVVMTDYEGYAAVWTCQRILFGHRQSAQIMGRKPKLDREVIRKIRKRFEGFGINEHYFSVVDQDKCGWDEAGMRREDCNCDPNNSSFSFKFGPFMVNTH